MANSYRTWRADTEQDYVTRLDSFLVNVVGWYRAFTYSDLTTDRSYSWVSEGESDDSRPARIIRVEAISDELRLDCGLVGEYNFATGDFGSLFVGTNSNAELRGASIPARCRSVANKNRVFISFESSATARRSGYLGYIDSFYAPSDDPQPCMVRGQTTSGEDWTGTSRFYALRDDDVEAVHDGFFNPTMTDEGYPSARNGSFSFYNPIMYYNNVVQNYEVRGRLQGIFYGEPTRLGHGAFISIGGDFYLCTKTTDEADAIMVGPVTEDNTIPSDIVQLGFPNFPTLKADYDKRGLEVDSTSSGTLSLWRFDVGHLNSYVYGSGAALPTPTVYSDELDNFDLTPQNSLASVESRLREAADFNGSNHYATSAGGATASGTLLNEWTLECVFKPDSLPTGGNRQTLISYGANSETEANNTLMEISLVAATGATPDSFNVERGNVEVLWEKDAGTDVSNSTTTDFIQEGRWNYLAITKQFNGGSYDVQVWHCSFNDHLVPEVKATFSTLDNATDGSTSSWFVGVDPALGDYFDGQIDDTRITKRVLTQSEIEASCLRAML